MSNQVEHILKKLCANDSCRLLANYLYQTYLPKRNWSVEDIQLIRTNYIPFTQSNGVFPYEVNNEKESNDVDRYEWDGSWKDYRIKNLKLSNFRKFPSTSVPFGIECCENGRPCSTILVGRNSVGKSSLYVAFEYVLRGTVGEARLRKFPEKQFVTHCDIFLVMKLY